MTICPRTCKPCFDDICQAGTCIDGTDTFHTCALCPAVIEWGAEYCDNCREKVQEEELDEYFYDEFGVTE